MSFKEILVVLKNRGNSGATYAWGLDAIRCFAMSLIAAKHLFSIHGYEEHEIDQIIPKGLGLATFSTLSGYLALQSKVAHKANGWLLAKLTRIYPSYFIAMTLFFLLNFLAGYKPMSWDLVFAQYFAVAAFTHPGKLIGVHTWFISLILICYVIACLVRRDRRILPAAVLVILALKFNSNSTALDSRFTTCILAFLAGGIVAFSSSCLLASFGVILACTFAVAMGQPEFSYPLKGTLSLMIGMSLTGRAGGFLRSAREITYEFYLVHGIVYLGLAETLGLNLAANALIGSPLSLTAAWVLAKLSRCSVEVFRNTFRYKTMKMHWQRE